MLNSFLKKITSSQAMSPQGRGLHRTQETTTLTHKENEQEQ